MRLFQRLVVGVVVVGGPLVMTSLGVLVAVVRRWRRLKHDGDHTSSSGSEVVVASARGPGRGIQLDDLIKLLCYTGWRRRHRGMPSPVNKPTNTSHTADTGLQVRTTYTVRHKNTPKYFCA